MIDFTSKNYANLYSNLVELINLAKTNKGDRVALRRANNRLESNFKRNFGIPTENPLACKIDEIRQYCIAPVIWDIFGYEKCIERAEDEFKKLPKPKK